MVSAGYLREIPADPITGKRDWRLDYTDAVLSPEQTATGIGDVHSASDRISPFEGTAYSTW
jgi:hypothetical protein